MRWLIVGALVAIGIGILVLRDLGDAHNADNAETDGAGSSAASRPEGARRAAGSSATSGSAPASPAPEAPALAANSAPGATKAKRGVGPWGLVGVFDETPAHYELTESMGRIAVNLTGGRSGMYSTGFPPEGTKTTIRGTVIDRNGARVAGAAVLIDTEFRMLQDSFLVDGGALSEADGSFVVTVIPMEQQPLLAMAIHPSAGWSSPVPISSEPLVVTLRSGALEGIARFNGHGASFNIVVSTEDQRLNIPIESHADGTFRIAPLATGTYKLSYSRAQAQAGNSAKYDSREIVIEDGKTTRVELGQQSGTMIVATAQVPQNKEPDTMGAALFTGAAVPKDASAASARVRAEKAPAHLIGGSDLAPVIQFHDVTPGDYVVCMYPHDESLFGCGAVRIVDGEATKHLEILLAATKP
ncbi:MAG: hypothetical protein ACKV2T_15765 [Kofleriaceae bacterium]